MSFRYQIGDTLVKHDVTILGTDSLKPLGYVSGMVTEIHKGQRRRPPKLFLAEWIEERCPAGVTHFAERVRVARKTVYAWINGRFPPSKYHGDIVHALSLDHFQDLYRPPQRPSIDAVTSDLPDEIHGDILEFALRLKKRAS